MGGEDVALDAAVLRKRVARFVDKELAVLPAFIELRRQAKSYGPMAIVGGLIRDLALGYARDFSSDVDIVLKDMPVEALASHLAPYGARRNAFGGFRVAFGRWLFDLWTFDNTWAFVNGYVEGRDLSDLLRTTFFNWDAALFETEDRELIARPSYFDELARRRLTINLRQTPNELGAAVRALRSMSAAEVSLTPDLAAFLHAKIVEHGIHQIVAEDAKRSGRRRLTTEFVGSVAIALGRHQETRPNSPFSLFSFQRDLPLDVATGAR
jgi:hypothetical protein